MTTLRDNMKAVVQRLLVTKGVASEEQCYEWACGISERMGLDELQGDQIGRLACVILTTLKGTTTLGHKPPEIPVVWINIDDLRREGVDSVEVF